MNKKVAIKKSLEQSFWQTYPTLSDHRDYTFNDLFPALKSSEYRDIFWQLVGSNELPLIPVIPLQNNDAVDRVELDYH